MPLTLSTPPGQRVEILGPDGARVAVAVVPDSEGAPQPRVLIDLPGLGLIRLALRLGRTTVDAPPEWTITRAWGIPAEMLGIYARAKPGQRKRRRRRRAKGLDAA